MRQSKDPTKVNVPYLLMQLLRVSLCPQYEALAVSQYYICRLSLVRVIQSSTMKQYNMDAHYNHKINQYGNKFVIELNKFTNIYF